MENYKLGAVKWYYSEIIVKDEIKASQYKVYDTYEQMIWGLLNNVVDAFIESTNVIKYYIEKNILVGHIILGKDGLFPLSVPFGVNKQRSDLVAYINLRLNSLKASGEYEMLYMKTFSSGTRDEFC